MTTAADKAAKATAADASKAPAQTPDSNEPDVDKGPNLSELDFHGLLNVVYVEIDTDFEDGPEKSEVLNDLTNLQLKLRAFDS